MADRKLMHTIIGKKNMYEVWLINGYFHVFRSGTKIDGGYTDLRKAVEKAEKEAKREG